MKPILHIGRVRETRVPLAVIMPLLPDTENCLVVYTERLPAELKQEFDRILFSDESQNCVNLSEPLSRRFYSSSGQSVLNTLHTHGFLKPLSIDDVDMNPIGNTFVPLREVLVASKIMPAKEGAAPFNPYEYNAKQANVGEAVGTARNLLAEADMLMEDARRKREQAYNMAPSLRPAAKEITVAEKFPDSAPAGETLPVEEIPLDFGGTVPSDTPPAPQTDSVPPETES